MGITLSARDRTVAPFFVSFWHWGAIVEAVRRLDIVPSQVVDGLREPFTGSGLTEKQAHNVASAITRELLPNLHADARLLLDGTITEDPDDGTFHRIDVEKNYSTSRKVLDEFAAFCRACAGFDVG